MSELQNPLSGEQIFKLMRDEQTLEEFTVSTDRARLDLKKVHHYLANESYWAQNRPFRDVEKSFQNSLIFGVYKQDELAGWARVVTDYATFGWLCDVFILKEFRGQGLSKLLVETIMAHPDLQGFRRFLLATKDAHGLYRQFGFAEIKRPDRWMEKFSENSAEMPDY